MVFDVSVAMTWLLFLALFPIAFVWLRRAWRITLKRDFSEVAIKRGLPPPEPERYAPWAMGINLVAGAVVAVTIVAVLLGAWSYDVWSAVAGSTIWCKFFADFGLSRHAHARFGRAKS